MNEQHLEHTLSRIETKLDILHVIVRALLRRIIPLSQALEDLKAEVALVVTDIGALAALIGASAAGTADAELASLTTQLKAATDAVAALLAPAPVVAPPPAA